MITKAQKSFLINLSIDQMTGFLVEDFKLDIPSALNIIYNSDVFSLLKEETNGLYSESPSYIYELLKKEYFKAALQ